MTLIRKTTGIAALVVLGALAPAATAATVVPPGNSAATQYTETLPTSNGAADLRDELDAGDVHPSEVIGERATEELESAGPDGVAVAALTASTAPVVVDPEPRSAPAAGGEGEDRDRQPAAAGSGRDGTPRPPESRPEQDLAQPAPSPLRSSDDGSGLLALASHTAGAGSGGMGLFLPLLILGALAYSLIYAHRRRVAG